MLAEPRGPQYRPTTMRRILGTPLALTIVTALLLAGCGSDPDGGVPADETASDPAGPAATSTPSPSQTQTDGDAEEPVDYEVLALVDETAVGGRTSPMLSWVDAPNELETFVAQFRSEAFGEEIRTAADTSYDGQLWAAVVSVGCDVPPDVYVEEGEAGYLITPGKVVDPLPECLAAVTTVALVAIEQP